MITEKCNSPSGSDTARRLAALAIGIGSLLWLLLRTGRKPSRAAYPCQRAAMANASALLGGLALPALLRGMRPVPAGLLGFAAAAALLAALAWSAGPMIGSVLKGGAAAAPRTVSLTLTSRERAAASYSDIFVVQGTTGADGGFQRLVDLMGQKGQPFSSLVGPADVVIIKVNSQWDERGGTNTDLVRSIIESLVKHPVGFSGEIVIADNGQAQYGAAGSGGSLDWSHNNAIDRGQSMEKVARSFSGRWRVSTALWDRITTTRVGEYSDGDDRNGYVVDSSASPRTGVIVSYPKFETAFGTRISFRSGIWDPGRRGYDTERLKVINVPVLKSHSIYGVTAAVKHYMGVGSDRLTRTAHRSVGRGGMGTEMARTRVPVLNVLDAVWINAIPGRGPRTSYEDAVQTGIIAASRDPVALDSWAARNVLLPAAQKLGYHDTGSLDPDLTARGSFGDWLRLSMKELQLAGYPAAADPDAFSVWISFP